MPKLTLAHLSALDLPPPAFISAAAEAGFDGVGLRLIQVTPTSAGYPLMDDPALMAQTKEALRDTGLYVGDIEFVQIKPETRVEDLLPFLDAGAELGAGQVITAPYDPDLGRLAQTLGAITEATKERGLGTVMEFFPWTVVPDLAACWDLVQAAGPDTGMLVDSLHFDRSGSSHSLLAAIPAERLPFAHLCDAPVQPSYTTDELLHNARAERFAPGDGQIDLAAYLRALPKDIPLGLEVPRPVPSEALPQELAHIAQATRALLAEL